MVMESNMMNNTPSAIDGCPVTPTGFNGMDVSLLAGIPLHFIARLISVVPTGLCDTDYKG